MSLRKQSPTSALVAHAERVISGSRILVIGNAQHILPLHLLERGARLVQVLDPDAKNVAHAALHNTERRISFAQLTESSLRDASFDCAIVEDLSTAPDAQRLLQGVKRSIGQRGLAFVCCPSNVSTSGLLGTQPGQLGFAELDELTGAVFEETILLGQAPFVGYAVVSLSLDEPPEPCLDNEFLGGEADPADLFIAICGSEEALSEVDLEDMTIVQLPASRVLEADEADHQRRELHAKRRIESLEAELRTLRERQGEGEVERLTRQLEQRDAWIRDLEARAENAEARADDAEAERERLEKALSETLELAADGQDATLLKERLDEAERVASRSQKETRWAEDRVRKLERELEAALAEIETIADAKPSAELQELSADLESVEDELEVAQKELRERGSELAKLKEALIGAGAKQAEAKALRKKLEEDKAQLEAERDQLSRETARLSRLLEETEDELEETHRDLLSVTERLDATQATPKKAAAQAAPALAEEVSALEAQLAERGRTIQALEEQLRRLELLGKSMSAEISLGRVQSDGAELEEKLGTLSQSLAEREADLVAAEWTIGELRQRLAARPS